MPSTLVAGPTLGGGDQDRATAQIDYAPDLHRPVSRPAPSQKH
jgi:hypothetical protein